MFNSHNMIKEVTMPLIRTSAIPNTCQQIKVRVRAATDEVVAKIMVDQPATEEGSEGSIQIFLDEEIRIIKSEIGFSRGIRI
ncbi:hypothetical protein LguiB_030673 [Lonicera macranthoides]